MIKHNEIIQLGLLILFICILVYCISVMSNNEGYYSYMDQEISERPEEPENDFKSEGGSYKELERESGKIKPAEGSCKSNTDPATLCLTYDSCCNGPNGSNCLCKNPIIKDCVSMYEECLQNNYLSEKNMSYLGNQNKHKVCRNILQNCCGIVKDIKIDANYQQVKMKIGNDKICDVQDSTPEMCKNMCNLNKDCKGYIFNKFSKECNVYSGEFLDKRKAYAKSDNNYQQFVKEGFKSGNDNVSGNGNGGDLDAMNICKNYDEKCGDTGKLSGNSNACICKHSITQDCKNQYQKCLKKDIEGLDSKLKKKYCQNMFGSCCQAINNIDVGERFKYEEPVGGAGISSNMVCYQEDAGLNLQKCQTRCTNNPDCNYIDTNTGLTTELRGDGNLYCGLYKGSPGYYNSGSTMKKRTMGKTIYIKKEITEKDKIKEELDKDE